MAAYLVARMLMPLPRLPIALRWLAVLAVLIALALVLAARARKAPARQYVTATADIGTVAPTVIASGTVNPVNTIQVGTYVSGVIQTLSCDFNTRARAGQLCARLDARPYQSVVDQESANLANAEAQLQKDRTNLEYTRQMYQRNADLLRRHFVAQQAVDTARNAYDQASSQLALDRATIAQRQAALNAARINLGYTRIVSPVDGTVVSRNVTQGQTVAASFQTPTLFLIATDLTKMQVDANVSESDIGRVAVGNSASFTVEAFPNRTFGGRVVQVRQAPQTVQNVITYDVVISVDNSSGLLMPGMTASARIVTERHDGVLRVPAVALRYAPAGTAGQRAATPGGALWILRDGQPRRVPVTLGLEDDNYAEIRAGPVHAGDPVVVSESGAGERARAATPRADTATVPRLMR